MSMVNGKGQPKRLAFPENFGGRKPRNVSCGDKSIVTFYSPRQAVAEIIAAAKEKE